MTLYELVNDKFMLPIEFKPRTKACIIHDMIRANTLERFSHRDDVQVGEFNKVFGPNIRDELFVRFKKMNKEFGVTSILTKQHKNYLAQQRIVGFPEEPTFLFAGYIPNEAWTDIIGIYLACWNGDVLEWYDEAGKFSYEQLSLDFESEKEAHRSIEKESA